MLTPDLWHSFLSRVGPRRMRLITVHALLTMACGKPASSKTYGEAVHKYLLAHWQDVLHRPLPGVWQVQAGQDLLPLLGLQNHAPLVPVLRRLITLAMEHKLESQHLAALVYGLAEEGVTRSDLHQRAWTARRHRGEASATRYGYMAQLVTRKLMVASQRTHRGAPFTVWHTTPAGRDLILATWARPTPATAPLRTAQPYTNRNAA